MEKQLSYQPSSACLLRVRRRSPAATLRTKVPPDISRDARQELSFAPGVLPLALSLNVWVSRCLLHPVKVSSHSNRGGSLSDSTGIRWENLSNIF